jgi:hypothetical protein
MAAEYQNKENNITISYTEIVMKSDVYTCTDVEIYKGKDVLGF